MNSNLGSDHEVYNDYARQLIRTKARHLSRRADFSRSDEDDIAQELTLHLLSQTSQFDPTRATVNTFVSLIIDSWVRIYLRKCGRLRKRPLRVEIETLSLPVEDPHDQPVELESLISLADVERRTGGCSQSEHERLEQEEALQLAICSLPAHLQIVCRQLMRGSPHAAARHLGISRRKLRESMDAIREHFQQRDLE